MKEPKRYYNLVENHESDVADLYIFGDISAYGQWWEDDPDRSAYNIVNELKAVTASNINVHINSYGGDVSEGLAIYNTLRGSGKNVTTICDGFACSAASVVFMAGSKRVMSPASLLMIHNAWTVARYPKKRLKTLWIMRPGFFQKMQRLMDSVPTSMTMTKKTKSRNNPLSV